MFIGQLFGIAIRNKIILSLHFATIVWKALANDIPTLDDLKEINYTTFNITNNLRKSQIEGWDDDLRVPLTWDAPSLDGRKIDLIPDGSKIVVQFDEINVYCDLYEQFKLNEYTQQLTAIRHGLSMIVPIQLFTILPWQEVKRLIAGELYKKMNIELLKKKTKYTNCKKDDKEVKWLFEILESMKKEMQSGFLRFVWGCSQLPLTEDGFSRKFEIVMKSDSNDLPKTHTCFFSIELPKYATKEIMMNKLHCAIEYGGSSFGAP